MDAKFRLRLDEFLSHGDEGQEDQERLIQMDTDPIELGKKGLPVGCEIGDGHLDALFSLPERKCHRVERGLGNPFFEFPLRLGEGHPLA